MYYGHCAWLFSCLVMAAMVTVLYFMIMVLAMVNELGFHLVDVCNGYSSFPLRVCTLVMSLAYQMFGDGCNGHRSLPP